MCHLFSKDKEKNEQETVLIVFRVTPKNYKFDITKNHVDEHSDVRFVSKEEFMLKKYNVAHNSLKELIKKTTICSRRDKYSD